MFRRSFIKLRIPILQAHEAIGNIPDGASIAVGGFGLCGVPFSLLEALNQKKTKDLTLIMGTMSGPKNGTGPLARDKQIKKAITTYVGENPVFYECLLRGEFDIEFCPMGSLIDRLRAAGAGMPAFYTPTGYGTAVANGELPVRFAPDGSVAVFSQPRETRCINGRWCTLENALHADYAFVRAWKADKRGNLVFRGTTRNFNVCSAKCAKVCIAEVDEIVECGALDPNEIHVSGVYVDALVKPPYPLKDVEFVVTRTEDSDGPSSGKAAEHERHVAARRAALEVQAGMNINLGIGTPMIVAAYISPEKDVMLQSENGLLGIGPYPLQEEIDCDITNAGKQTVTISKNGASLFDSAESFAMMRGGHMDLTMLGALEVSEQGDIASWYVPGKILKGMGGAMDLVASGCRTVILMKHTSKSGRSRLVKECKAPLTGRGCADMIISELATFVVRKTPGGVNRLVLTELAEGVTLEEVRAKTDASFEVASDLKTMPLAPLLHSH